MPRSRNTKHECHVTDAVGLVHRASVSRSIDDNGHVVSVMVATACELAPSRWTQRESKCAPEHLPKAWDLPKIMHGHVLLVKYDPKSIIAPLITCVACAAWVDW